MSDKMNRGEERGRMGRMARQQPGEKPKDFKGLSNCLHTSENIKLQLLLL